MSTLTTAAAAAAAELTMEELSQLDIQLYELSRDTILYVDGVKVVITANSQIRLYLSDDLYCCQLANYEEDWILELEKYAEVRQRFLSHHSADELPAQLSTGSNTIYFMSALAYCLHIDTIMLLDRAKLPVLDLQLSLIKLALGQGSFYEKFGYQTGLPGDYNDFKDRLRQFTIATPDFYLACYNFYYRKTAHFGYDIKQAGLVRLSELYQESDVFIKQPDVRDLWHYQLSQ